MAKRFSEAQIRIFRLRDYAAIFSILAGIITLGSVVGSYYVNDYQIGELRREVDQLRSKGEFSQSQFTQHLIDAAGRATDQAELAKRVDACCPRSQVKR